MPGHLLLIILMSFLQGRLDEALDRCEQYYEVSSQKKQPDSVFNALTGIFDIYRQKGDYEKSFFYARKMYEISEKADNPHWLAEAAWCLAELYFDEGDYTDALTYYQAAAALPHGKTKGINPENNLGLELPEVFAQLHRFDSAWHRYATYNGDTTAPAYLISTGECHFMQGKFQQALSNFTMALTRYRQSGNIIGQIRAFPDIARAYIALNQPKTALLFARAGLGLAMDTRSNQYLRDDYSILSDAWSLLERKDSSNFYFSKYSGVKDGILNDMVKARITTWPFEEQMDRILRQKDAQTAELQKASLLKKVLLASLLVLIILAFASVRIARLKARARQAVLMQQQTDLELKALRARMDPHFIFNCLNSINRFIIRNDAAKAADYLTKFAKLMRMVLESSAIPYIPLEEELSMLNFYLTLENLRFEQPFVVDIDTGGIETSYVLVPTLIIQPFVENAIWHGLYPRQSSTGRISISLRLEGNLLHCKIEDNGIGRKRSATHQNPAVAGQAPVGIPLTTERLERIGPLYSKLTGVSIEDMMDDAGKDIGTRVWLKIPVKFI